MSDRPATAPEPVMGNAVAIRDFAFEPPVLSTTAGTLVTWTNDDDVAHTVSSEEDDTFDSGAFGQGEVFQFMAETPGTYTYICRLHPFMQATLIVTP